MCSIMGYLGKRIPLDLLVDGFYKTISRGPDLSRMLSVGDGYLMFHRLTIMGLEKSGMQPFERNGDAVVCNGELYGFRKMRDELFSGYDFKSGSDCELLLPLFQRYGTDMF